MAYAVELPRQVEDIQILDPATTWSRGNIANLASFAPLGLLVVGSLAAWIVLSEVDPERLNRALRSVIIYGNSMYVIYSCTSVFWIFIPIYLCVFAQFPFPLDVRVAGLGSLALKAVEIMVVSRMTKAQVRRLSQCTRRFAVSDSEDLSCDVAT